MSITAHHPAGSETAEEAPGTVNIQEEIPPNSVPPLSAIARWAKRAAAELCAEQDQSPLQAVVARLAECGRLEAPELAELITKGDAKKLGLYVEGLDKNLFAAVGQEVPGRIKFESIQLHDLPNMCIHLAVFLYKNYGEEMFALCSALLLHARRFGVLVAMDEREFLKQGLQESTPEQEGQIIFWALGPELSARMKIFERPPAEIAQVLKKLLAKSLLFRINMISAVQKLLLLADLLLVSAQTRNATALLLNADEVTEFEWWAKLKKQSDDVRAQQEKARAEVTGEMRTYQAKCAAEIEDFFAKNTPQAPQKLVDLVGCDRLRQELLTAKKEYNGRAVRMKMREIITRVLCAVSRYQNLDQVDRKPTWELGLPGNVLEKKTMSCFSAPWLVAALLLKCGIPYYKILYCHSYKTNDNVVGGHGSLLIEEDDEYFFADPNYTPEFIHFPLDLYPRAAQAQVKKMLALEREDELLLEDIEDAGIVENFNVHKEIAVMPLSAGLTSGHMLNIGIGFLQENKLDEAEHAFKLGILAFQQDADLNYNLGIVYIKKGDEKKAEHYLQSALHWLPEHLKSRFALGEMHLRRGEVMQAKMHFALVVSTPVTIYLGAYYKKIAARVMKTPSADLTIDSFDKIVAEELE